MKVNEKILEILERLENPLKGGEIVEKSGLEKKMWIKLLKY